MAQYSRKLAKGVKWYFKFDLNSKTHYSKCIYATKAEAKKAEREYLNKLEILYKRPNNIIDFLLGDLISERLNYLKTKTGNSYYKMSVYYLNKLSDALGNIPIIKISKNDLNKVFIAYSQDLNKHGKDNYAVNSMIKAVGSMFNFGIKYLNLGIPNPCQGISSYPIKKRLKYVPSDDEINAILAICTPQQKQLIEFVRDTGARIGEALRITYGDIYDNYVVLYTRKNNQSDLVPRKVPKPVCLAHLSYKSHKVFDYSHKPLFLWDKQKKLGLEKWGWHCLRHRYASILSKQGVPLFEIMSLLGHHSLDITQKYLHLIGF